MKKYTFKTDDFSTIKRMVHNGQLDDFKTYFSILRWKWMYKGKFSA